MEAYVREYALCVTALPLNMITHDSRDLHLELIIMFFGSWIDEVD